MAPHLCRAVKCVCGCEWRLARQRLAGSGTLARYLSARQGRPASVGQPSHAVPRTPLTAPVDVTGGAPFPASSLDGRWLVARLELWSDSVLTSMWAAWYYQHGLASLLGLTRLQTGFEFSDKCKAVIIWRCSWLLCLTDYCHGFLFRLRLSFSALKGLCHLPH